jgi:hypothetical protein
MQLVDIKSRSGRILISVSLIWILIATLLALNSGGMRLDFGEFMLGILIFNAPLIGFWLYRWIKQGKPSDEA